jgi:heterodisulfide reductase subunit B
MDLECFQDQMNTRFHDDIQIPILYFSQLVGMAFGIPGKNIGLRRLFIQPKLPAIAQGG